MVACRTACLLYLSLFLLLHLAGCTTDEANSSHTAVGPVTSRIPTIVRTIKGERVMERIEIRTPTYANLSCAMVDSFNGQLERVKGYWAKDGEKMNQSTIQIQRDKDGYYQQKEFLIDAAKLGNYSCVFHNENTNFSKIFIISAPSMKERRHKPVVGYIGDSGVLTCKIKPAPEAWLWYRLNGTEKELINISANPHRYSAHLHKDEHRLSIMNLNEEDSGSYLCTAVYPIGPVEDVVILRVITFMEPLKPFLAILVEVVLLVALILGYELQGRKKSYTPASENGLSSEQTENLRKEETNGIQENTTAKQWK